MALFFTHKDFGKKKMNEIYVEWRCLRQTPLGIRSHSRSARYYSLVRTRLATIYTVYSSLVQLTRFWTPIFFFSTQLSPALSFSFYMECWGCPMAFPPSGHTNANALYWNSLLYSFKQDRQKADDYTQAGSTVRCHNELLLVRKTTSCQSPFIYRQSACG